MIYKQSMKKHFQSVLTVKSNLDNVQVKVWVMGVGRWVEGGRAEERTGLLSSIGGKDSDTVQSWRDKI